MNKIYKWLISKKLFVERKNSLSDNSKIIKQEINKNAYYNKSIKKYCSRKMQVEILGEPRVRRTCLSPRSTPIVLEINFCPKLRINEAKLSKSMKVEWESTHDEVIARKSLDFKSIQEYNYEDLQSCENELSVAYLGRQNKRVYLDGNELTDTNKKVFNDDFDSIKVNLSKKGKLEISSSRYLHFQENYKYKEINEYNDSEDLIIVEEWLFEK